MGDEHAGKYVSLCSEVDVVKCGQALQLPVRGFKAGGIEHADVCP